VIQFIQIFHWCRCRKMFVQ